MITTQGLSKYYGSFCAVNNLSLTINRGELFCFLGPNGAGKTTTIKMLAGLVKPTGGCIEISGIDISEDPLKARSIMGYIPDMPYIYERLTPVEFMEFIGEIYRMDSNLIAENMNKYLHIFGLNGHRDKLIRDFSHGMRQRLLYAATLLHEPQVLLIDEPLIALDPHTIRLLKDMLISMARSGKAIFVTTHILALAEDIADRIGIIEEGCLIAQGTCAELLAAYGGSSLEDVFLNVTSSSGTINGIEKYIPGAGHS